MKTSGLQYLIYTVLFFIVVTVTTACRHHNRNVNPMGGIAIKDTVIRMTNNISRDLAAKGPIAWLDYFAESPQFFMISDGQLSFSSYSSAKSFIPDTLVKNMTKIALQWKDMRVEILSRRVVSVCSGFHEDITMANGKNVSYDGYFSGTAADGPKGWRFLNLHWSTPKAAN